MEIRELSELWNELKTQANDADNSSRLYRALGKTAVGVRASFLPFAQTMELLVEVPLNWREEMTLRQWRGMKVDFLPLVIDPRKTHQLSLQLTDQTAETIFLHISADLASSLEGITDPATRVAAVVECLDRWSRFFQRTEIKGLSRSEQQGLFAELLFLFHLINKGISTERAVNAWKGATRGYHDFDLEGRVVEVKSTAGKEPRCVYVNNERQLDDRGLKDLHLYVVTLQQSEGSGMTLPELVQALRGVASKSRSLFDHSLIAWGYSDVQSGEYTNHYITRTEELFSIQNDFPRIISVPDGVGDLRYSVALSACREYERDLETFLDSLVK